MRKEPRAKGDRQPLVDEEAENWVLQGHGRGGEGGGAGETKTIGHLLQITNPQTTLLLLLMEAKSQFHTTKANDTTKHMESTTWSPGRGVRVGEEQEKQLRVLRLWPESDLECAELSAPFLHSYGALPSISGSTSYQAP